MVIIFTYIMLLIATATVAILNVALVHHILTELLDGNLFELMNDLD